jgi:predicted HicB family RNase H-like nuclease
MKKVLLRVDDKLLDRIDARAAKVGLSRNAWLVKALDWAVTQPVTTRVTEERI